MLVVSWPELMQSSKQPVRLPAFEAFVSKQSSLVIAITFNRSLLCHLLKQFFDLADAVSGEMEGQPSAALKSVVWTERTAVGIWGKAERTIKHHKIYEPLE